MGISAPGARLYLKTALAGARSRCVVGCEMHLKGRRRGQGRSVKKQSTKEKNMGEEDKVGLVLVGTSMVRSLQYDPDPP